MNRLLASRQRDQFVWLGHISRRLITGGGLRRLIDEDGLGSVTSNRTIPTRRLPAAPIMTQDCIVCWMPTAV